MTAQKGSKGLKKETVKDLDAPAEQAGGVKGGADTRPVRPGMKGGKPDMKAGRRGLTQNPGANPGPAH